MVVPWSWMLTVKTDPGFETGLFHTKTFARLSKKSSAVLKRYTLIFFSFFHKKNEKFLFTNEEFKLDEHFCVYFFQNG